MIAPVTAPEIALGHDTVGDIAARSAAHEDFGANAFAPSTQTMRAPGAARAQKTAAASPAAPAPTMTTSAVSRVPHSAEARRIRTRSAGHTRCNLAHRDARPLSPRPTDFDAKQEDRMKRFTSIAAAVFTAAFLTAASSALRAGFEHRSAHVSYLQRPRADAGRDAAGEASTCSASPDTALHNVMQVFDGDEKHIIGQWFFIPKNRTTRRSQSRPTASPS